ncbi:MAG: cadmium-translocating P-type ATPase [Clostridia bacterium]|nr:cadmium-translocating P-type ATPase [Clostridia bacterium]
MTRNQKSLVRIVALLVAYAVVIALSLALTLHPALEIALFVAVYVGIGYDIIWKAVRNTIRGNLFDENFLMTIATIGAFAIGEYIEAVAVMMLYQIGELFQRYAVAKGRKNIAELMDIRPETATMIVDGEEVEVHPSEIQLGDILVVKAGDKIPLDGIVVEGCCNVDTRAITGESLPKWVDVGDDVVSGCILLDGSLKVQATCDYDNSTVAKILDLVENATANKAPAEKFITKFSKYYTPIVVILAVLVGVVPPLFDGLWTVWLKRAMMFLFVSCPCALVISVPMGFFGGITASSKMGVLVKGSNYLETLAKANVFAFDKTGTLTKGNFVVTDVFPAENRNEVLELASICEQYSNHPIAVAINNAFPAEKRAVVTEMAGLGIVAEYVGGTILCGNEQLLAKYDIEVPQIEQSSTTVFVAKNGKFVGYITIADQIKADSPSALAELSKNNCTTVMLTGDSEQVAQKVASDLGIENYHAELLPQDKVAVVEQLKQKGVVAFVGDGINDAPVLIAADVGIAMGKMGSDVAVESADIVLMNDNPKAIVTAKKIAKKTLAIVKQNIVFSIAVKVAVLVLSAIGLLDKIAFGLIVAILADVGVCVLAILNSLRAMVVKEK